MMRKVAGVFVTGTDTGVGKTHVACRLVRSLREGGLDVGVMKPVSAGSRADARRLRSAAGVRDSLARINPVWYSKAAAPAAILGGRRFPISRVLAAWRCLAHDRRFMVVEGIGGVQVPLDDRLTGLDLMRALAIPALIVARAGLGTLNHTLLTVEALRRARVPVFGIVLNGKAGGYAGKTNPALLRRLTGLSVWRTPWRRKSNVKR